MLLQDLQMRQGELDNALTEEQALTYKLLLALVNEKLKTGYNARIIVEISGGRINSLQSIDFIAGLSQSSYHLDKLS